ncbi:MAG: hypothetical protein ACTTH8_00180 [Treponema sp.]
MNQDQIKEILLQIEETSLDFSVTFTGKTSKKVNGLYKPDIHEIILHNKNFSGDNELLYTAIHEYTHHRLCEADGGVYSSRVHTQRFWSTFHQLLKKAEEKGFYRIMPEDAPELLELTETIRSTIMTEDGKLMKELGRLLGKARTLCKTAGVRYEDYIDRVLCLPRTAASTIEKMHAFDVKPELGYEAMKVVANITNPDKRRAAESMFLENYSPASVRDSIKTKPAEEEPRRKLEKEKHRLEKAIACLQQRLNQVEDSLANIPVAPFIMSIIFFTQALCGSFADSVADTRIQIPEIPAVPSIEIGQGLGAPIQRPSIKPPVIQPIVPKQKTAQKSHTDKMKAADSSSAANSPAVGNVLPPASYQSDAETDKNVLPVNGLNARMLSSLAKNSGNLLFFDTMLSGVNQVPQASTTTMLNTILTELEKIRQNTEKSATKAVQSAHKPPETQESGSAGSIAADAASMTTTRTAGSTVTNAVNGTETSSTGSAAKTPADSAPYQPAAELVRLRINNREIKNDLTDSFCSAAGENGSFLYGADRRFIANGKELNETIYFFGKKNADGFYEIAIELRQDPINRKSFLYKLYTLSPLAVRQTSDLLFWHYQDNTTAIEVMFRILDLFDN